MVTQAPLSHSEVKRLQTLVEQIKKLEALLNSEDWSALRANAQKLLESEEHSPTARDQILYFLAVGLDMTEDSWAAYEIFKELNERNHQPNFHQSLNVVLNRLCRQASDLAESQPENPILIRYEAVLRESTDLPYKLRSAVAQQRIAEAIQNDNLEKARQIAREAFEPLLQLSPYDVDYFREAILLARIAQDSAQLRSLRARVIEILEARPYLIAFGRLLEALPGGDSTTTAGPSH